MLEPGRELTDHCGRRPEQCLPACWACRRTASPNASTSWPRR